MSFKARNILPYFYLSLPFFGFSVFSVGQRGLRIDWVISIVFVISMTGQVLLGKMKRINIDSVSISFFVLLFFVSLSIQSPLLSRNPQNITDFFTTYSQFLLGAMLFIFAYNLSLPHNDLKLILKCILVISGLISVFAILQLMLSYFGYDLKLPFTNPGRAAQHSGYENATGRFLRATGTFSEPRQLGAYLLTGVAISAWFWAEKVRLFHTKFFQGFLFWLISFGVICSLSTGAILLLFAVIFFVFVFKTVVRKGLQRKGNLTRCFCLCCIIGLLGIGISLSPLGTVVHGRIRMPELESIYEIFFHLPEKAHRWRAYVRGQRLALEVFADNLIFGVGLNNFHIYVEANYGDLIGPKGCHGPLRYLAQTGIFGVIGFGIFVVSLITKLRKKWKCAVFGEEKQMADLGLILIAVSLMASFGSLFSLTSTFFWANMTLSGLLLSGRLNTRGTWQTSRNASIDRSHIKFRSEGEGKG